MKIFLMFTVLLFVSCFNKGDAIPNPWVECGDDISCGASVTGFNLPVKVKDYSVRAMKDMLEITFPLEKRINVTIRKSMFYGAKADKNGIKDISGNYNNYPVNKTIYIKKSVPFNVRGKKGKFYVANFAAESGYYSFYSKDGMKIKHIKSLYEIIAEAETKRYNEDDEKSSYTIEQLQDLRRQDEIVEPIYTQDCFPRTLEKKGVTFACFERANLGDDSICSMSEIKMIKEYYKKGQDKDPLNNGDGGFCAKSDR